MTATASTLTYATCRTIDRAEGVEDGRLYPAIAKRVKHEHGFC